MFSVTEDESHILGGRSRVEYTTSRVEAGWKQGGSRVEYTTRFTHGRVRYSVNPAQRLPQPVTLRIITNYQKKNSTDFLYKTVFAEI